MPSWDIALCQLDNVQLLHDTYLVKRRFILLYLRDKFRDQPHVHIVFHLASRLFTAARPAQTTVAQAFALCKHALLGCLVP